MYDSKTPSQPAQPENATELQQENAEITAGRPRAEITFLGSRDVVGAKRFRGPQPDDDPEKIETMTGGARYVTVSYACGFGPYGVVWREVADLPELLSALRACPPNWFYVRGDARGAETIPYRRKLARDEQPATLYERALHIVPIDLDGGVCAPDASLAERAQLGRDLLPAEFRLAACIAQATSSCKIKSGLRIRLYYICETPIANAECKQLFDGIADVGIYSAEHVTYVCDPTFDGVPDPFAGESRWLLIETDANGSSLSPRLTWPANGAAAAALESAESAATSGEVGLIGVGDRHRMLTVHAGQLARLKLPADVIEEQLVAFSEHAFAEPLPASRRGEITALARRAAEWSDDAPELAPAPPEHVRMTDAAAKELKKAIERVKKAPEVWIGELERLAPFVAAKELSRDHVFREISAYTVGNAGPDVVATKLDELVAAAPVQVFAPMARSNGELAGVMPQLRTNDEGGIVIAVDNMAMILSHVCSVWQDARSGGVMLERAPWLTNGSRSLSEHDGAYAAEWLCGVTGWARVPAAPLAHLRAIAAKRMWDPWRGWLESLKWDGNQRLAYAAREYLGASTSREGLCFALWLISAVARTLKPGCQVDHMIALESPEEGLRKTSFLRELVGESYYARLECELDTSKPRVVQALQGPVIVELPELVAITKSTAEQAKAFLDERIDHWVDHHARSEDKRHDPRKVVFCGTTNTEHWLSAVGEHRRFWPIRVTKVDIDALRANREQLWAEAVAHYQAGHAWHFTPEQAQAYGLKDAATKRKHVSGSAEVLEERLRQPLVLESAKAAAMFGPGQGPAKPTEPAERAQERSRPRWSLGDVYVEPWQLDADGRLVAVTAAQAATVSGIVADKVQAALRALGWTSKPVWVGALKASIRAYWAPPTWWAGPEA